MNRDALLSQSIQRVGIDVFDLDSEDVAPGGQLVDALRVAEVAGHMPISDLPGRSRAVRVEDRDPHPEVVCGGCQHPPKLATPQNADGRELHEAILAQNRVRLVRARDSDRQNHPV
jgi:hypothetical protein